MCTTGRMPRRTAAVRHTALAWALAVSACGGGGDADSRQADAGASCGHDVGHATATFTAAHVVVVHQALNFAGTAAVTW